MKTTLFAAIAVAGLIVALPAIAQQPGPGGPPAAGGSGPVPGPGPGYGPGARGFGWGPGSMMWPGMMGSGGMRGICDPRAAGLAEWRLDRIESVVKPNEPQRTALNELRAASTKAADLIAAACPREFPASAPARLELTEKRLDAMLQAVKTVRPAFDAFYATLNDEQKARINAAGPNRWGWRGWWRQ